MIPEGVEPAIDMDSTLERLLDEGIISEVLGRLQSGKEAEVV